MRGKRPTKGTPERSGLYVNELVDVIQARYPGVSRENADAAAGELLKQAGDALASGADIAFVNEEKTEVTVLTVRRRQARRRL